MTITKALRKLYAAIVGSELDSSVNSITKVLIALADNWPSPEQTESSSADDTGDNTGEG